MDTKAIALFEVRRSSTSRYAQGTGKRLLDILVAALLLFLCLPLLVLLWIAVKYDGGPGLFRHQRVGRGGCSFDCLKLRTMTTDADIVLATWLAHDSVARDQWQASHKLHHDPRVTRIGRILRRTSLDELPQLFNVLRGDMSLVGPRPIVPAEFEKFYIGDAGRAYTSLRPGLTGVWQVSGRSHVAYAERIALDVSYAGNLSLRNDIRILLLTIPAVLQKRGAW